LPLRFDQQHSDKSGNVVSEGELVTNAERNPGEEGGDDAASRAGTAKNAELLQEFSAGGGATGAAPTADRSSRMGKYDQLWQLSMADPHTGLANQLLALDRLTQALARRRRHGGEVVVCHVDLVNLREIEDDRTLGYTAAQAVLVETSRRLTSVLRTEDTVGRVGGSELVIVVTVNDEQDVGPLMRRIQHAVDEPVMVDGRGVRVRASLGVAIAEDAESAEEVLARADRSTRVTRR
jgi:diguanylate cyclase (GGDEF)-like protein